MAELVAVKPKAKKKTKTKKTREPSPVQVPSEEDPIPEIQNLPGISIDTVRDIKDEEKTVQCENAQDTEGNSEPDDTSSYRQTDTGQLDDANTQNELITNEACNLLEVKLEAQPTVEVNDSSDDIQTEESAVATESESWHSCKETASVASRTDLKLDLPETIIDDEPVEQESKPVDDSAEESQLSLEELQVEPISWPPDTITEAPEAPSENSAAEKTDDVISENPAYVRLTSGGQEGSREVSSCPQADPGPGGVTSPTSPTSPSETHLENEVEPDAKETGDVTNNTQNDAVVVHPKLYPKLETPHADELAPFTEGQLRTLYYNNQLEHNDEFVDRFLQEVVYDKHEFHEILLNYYRARNNLANAEHDIDVLRKDQAQYSDMVWETREEKLTVQGQCQDKSKVSGEHVFHKAYYNETAAQDAARTLKNIRSQIHSELSLFAYEAQLSRLQVESYLHQLYVKNPDLTNLPPNAPVTAWLSHQRDGRITHQIENLKLCISILFMFQRKPAKDDVFVRDTRGWLSRLVGTLLRLATLDDHLFIINHTLRSPTGLASWATSYIQVLPPRADREQTGWGSPLLDHFLTMLATILSPLKKREELLYQLKVTLTPVADKNVENPWILVDSDGEEDEDPSNSWHFLQENDVVSLLNQLPMDHVYRLILNISRDNNETTYDVHRTSEAALLKTFALATRLIKILDHGLNNFCLARYRQLNKRLGRMIRDLVHYLHDHWEAFQQAYPTLQPQTRDRLQVEYDAIVHRAVAAILSARKLGSWQFLTDLPYDGVSVPTLWRLLIVMHLGCQKSGDLEMDRGLSVQECQARIIDADNKLWFEEQLVTLPTAEATFLLTTFANMARSRSPDETIFIETITTEIYEIAYIRRHTREFCSKPGRELLASIAAQHPTVLSMLLKATHDTMDNIGMVSLYLYQELPLSLWTPSDADWTILREWLLNHKPSSPEFQLAMLVVDKLNWGLNVQSNSLFLPLDVHHKMAVLLVEVYTTCLTGKSVAGLFTEGVKLQAPVKGHQSEDTQVASWAWEVGLRLHLHSTLMPRPPLGTPDSTPPLEDVPDIHSDPALLPVQTAVKGHFSFAYYVTLMMTKAGHDPGVFNAEGVTLLSGLAEKSHFIPLLRALACVTPMFFQNTGQHHLFTPILQSLLGVDATRKSYFSSEFPGPVTTLLCGMIQSQIQSACIPGGVSAITVIEFWLILLTNIPNWLKDRAVCHVVDMIAMSASRIQGAETRMLQFLKSLQEDYLKEEKDKGVLTSLVSWLAAASARPSLLDPAAYPGPWFSYLILHLETNWEWESGLWKQIQKELFSGSGVTIDAALKKAVSALKIEPPLTLDRLAIYRWGTLAVETDVSHPLLPLIWQRFFLLYLGRLATEPGLPQRGSVGEKFFQNPSYNSMSKRMKKKLAEAADYFHKQSEMQRRRSGTPGVQSPDMESSLEESYPPPSLLEPDSQAGQQEFYQCLVSFYQTISFWLDEPRLHDPALYLPALPPQYQPDRLLHLFQYRTDVTLSSNFAWREFIDFRAVDSELTDMVGNWAHLTSRDLHHDNWSHVQQKQSTKRTASERILSRLMQHTRPLPPPELITPKPPLPDLNPNLLCDQQNLLFALRSDLNTLVDYAKLYALRVSKNVGLDETYIELLPSWYTNETTEAVLTIPCRSMINPAHSCKGAAVITCRYDAIKRDDIINRKIDENRAEYKQMMIESLLPPAQCVCSAAVHVENTITSLIKLCQGPGNAVIRQKGCEVGTALFYHLATYVSEDSKFYPPTCQFFASCIEVLGQAFIVGNPAQSQALLQAILQNPSLVGLLSPNFTPNASPELFVTMYEDLIRVPTNQGADVTFTLLTKFDVPQWLEVSGLTLSMRSALVEVVGTALCQCGLEPEPHIRGIFQMYRIHLQHLLKYRFPDHFGEVLKLIVKGCDQERINPLLWEDFLVALEGTKEGEVLEDGQRRPSVAERELSPNIMRETMQWLTVYFTQSRISSQESASFGLYPKWSAYVEGLAAFFNFLCTNNISAVATSSSLGHVHPETAVDQLWKQMLDLFTPWIQPLDNGGQMLSPWIQTDTAKATMMLSVWVTAVSHLQTAFDSLLPAFSRHALTLLWPHYVTKVARKSTPEHVLTLYHSQLITLPWDKFFPDIQAIELMVQIYDDNYHPSCFEFLGNMFTRIPWAGIVHHSIAHDIPEISTRLHVCFFRLLVQLSKEKPIMENTSLPQLMVTAESFNWNYLDAASYTSVVEWFLANCDPKCILSERTSNTAKVLSLLKQGAGFTAEHDPTGHPETPVKRAQFVRCVAQLLCKCSHLKDVDFNVFRVVITNLITEVETLIGTIPDPVEQRSQAVGLSVEVLAMLNNCNPVGVSGGTVLETVQEWIGSSPTSVLLFPLLTAACRGLASLSYMVRIVEACIDAHFSTDVTAAEMRGWLPMLATVEIPEMSREQFLREAVIHSCYLTLYSYTLQQQPLCQGLDQELNIAEQITDWIVAAKPNPASETKLYLLWAKHCELVMRQVDFGAAHGPITTILHKCIPAVTILGEDKASGGILGAIGLGKRSQLSTKFRFIAKVMSTYLAAQIPRDNKLRSVPNAPGLLKAKRATSPVAKSPTDTAPSQQATQAYSHLDNLRSNKEYAELREHLEFSLNFIVKPENCIREAWGLLVQLLQNIYPHVTYLEVLTKPSVS